MLIITNKFIKKVQLILRKNIWSAEEWEITLINRLLLINWDISIILLSNRDRKFLSEFWKRIFKILNIKLMYSAVYHSQTDEASEQINQIIKIAFRFYINNLNKFWNWQQAVLLIQAALNSAVSSMTDHSLNKLAFDINFNMSINLLNQKLDKIQNFIIHINIEKAIKLSQMTMKHYYDNKHQSKFFNINDNIMLWLHKDYSILIIINKKLAQQYASCYDIHLGSMNIP